MPNKETFPSGIAIAVPLMGTHKNKVTGYSDHAVIAVLMNVPEHCAHVISNNLFVPAMEAIALKIESEHQMYTHLEEPDRSEAMKRASFEGSKIATRAVQKALLEIAKDYHAPQIDQLAAKLKDFALAETIDNN